MVKIFLQLQENLMGIENASESVLNKKKGLVNQKSGSRSNGRGCTSRFPLMEQALYDDYEEAWDEGKTIKR